MDAMDSDLMNAVDALLNSGGQLLASIMMIVLTAPWVLVVMVPISLIAYRLQALYRV